MCSQEEIQFRIKVGLVSIFELDSLTKKPDETKMVKMFVRSAASFDEKEQKHFRDLKSLDQSIDYLLKFLINFNFEKKNDLKDLYLFIHDRIKAIKQDLVRNIQENIIKSKVFQTFVKNP